MARNIVSLELRRFIASIARRYRVQLTIAYALTLTENLCYVSFPSLIGVALDGFTHHRAILAAPLAAAWMFRLGVGTIRLVFDTKVFADIYGNVATGLVVRQRNAGIKPLLIVARVSLSRELVAFFEDIVPALASTAVRLCGALIMMLFYDWMIAGFAVFILIPIASCTLWFSRKSLRLNAALNNRFENEPRIVGGSGPPQVSRHFRRLCYWRVRLARAQAATWAVSEIAIIVLAIWTIAHLLSPPGVSAGTVYAVLSYIWSFHQSVDEAPHIVQNVARILDISQRVAASARVDHPDTLTDEKADSQRSLV